MLSSFFGAAFGGVIGTVAAAAAVWISLQWAPRSMLGMWLAVCEPLPVGLLGGAGSVVGRFSETRHLPEIV